MPLRKQLSQIMIRPQMRYLVSLTLSSIVLQAVADEFDTVQLNASLNKIYDDNIFRQSNNEISDTITISKLGFKFDKSYSLQRFKVDADITKFNYDKTEFLDYDAKNYSAAWLWSLTPNLTGRITSEQTQVLNDFRDFAIPIQNIRTSKIQRFRAEYSPHQIWTIIGGLTYTNVTNSQQFTQQADFNALSVDYGAKYKFPSGSSLTFLGHQRKGDFSDRPVTAIFDNGYDESEFEVEAVLKASGKSSLSGKLGYINREYNNLSLRDYQSIIGYINYDWYLTGKMLLNLNYSRTIYPFEQSNSTYSLTDAIKSELSYNITEKLQAGVNLRLSDRDFDGRGQFSTIGRTDREQGFGGSIRWTPLWNISVSLNANRSYRNSTISQFDFNDTTTSINFDLKI
jgi:exopolysaccharide biosynthesis operon protein EpsL